MKIAINHLDFRVKVKNQDLFDKTFAKLKKQGFSNRESFVIAIEKILSGEPKIIPKNPRVI